MITKAQLRWLSYPLVAIAAGYFAYSLVENFGRLPRLSSRLVAEAVIVGSVVYVGITLTTGCLWHLLLRSMGVQATARTSLTIFSVAQFGKYIPGNFASQVGRVALARQAGMDARVVVASMAIEILMILGSASIVVLSGLGSIERAFFLSDSGWLGGNGFVLLCCVAVVSPFILVALSKRMPTKLRQMVSVDGRFPGVSVLCTALALNTAAFWFLGLIAYIVAVRAIGLHEVSYFFLSTVFAFAMVAGFVTPGAPAGLGVREAIILALLTPVYGGGEALALTVLVRLVTLIGDALAFGGGLLARLLETRSETVSGRTGEAD